MNATPKLRHNDLYGLVLAGGKSERMGADKGLLHYHDKPQRQWLADLLAAYCSHVVISVRQVGVASHEAGLLLPDAPAFADNGPIGALMTAQEKFPGAAWLVVSCDLPYFDAHTAQALLAARDGSAAATAFLNPENMRPEPLVTIYEAAFMRALPHHFARGERSMMHLLHRDATVRLIREYDPDWIISADTPEAFAEAKSKLSR